jgi:hypothetical protein
LGRKHIAFSFAYKGNLYIMYECLRPIATQSNHAAKLIIVDILLTLILRMGRGVCHFIFCIQIQPIRHFERLRPVATQSTEGGKPKIIDMPLTIISECGRECDSLVVEYTGGQYIRKRQ